MKRKPNKPQQEPRERPGSSEEPADPGGASSGGAGGSPGGAGAEGTSGQSVHKSKFRQKSKQEQAAASKLRMEKRGEKLEAARGKLAKQKPPKKPGPVRRVGRAAGGAAHGFVHGKIYENEQENVGIEGAHRSELVGEAALRHGSRFVKRKVREHPAKAVQRAESKYVKATADYHFRMAAQEHPEMSGNPVSRMWRKHRLKKQYQKRAREAVKTGAAGAAKKTAAATEKAGAKAVGFVKRHPVGVVLALAFVLLLFMMQSCSSSLVTLGNAGAGAVGATTYPSQDEEMLAAEAAYCGMEAELQDYLDSYELRPSRNNLDIRRQMDSQAQVVGKWEDAHRVPDQKRLTWFYPDFGSYVVKEYITPEQLASFARGVERQEALRLSGVFNTPIPAQPPEREKALDKVKEPPRVCRSLEREER